MRLYYNIGGKIHVLGIQILPAVLFRRTLAGFGLNLEDTCKS